MDQPLNMPMEVKYGGLMVSVIGLMGQQLNMLMERKYGLLMVNFIG